MTNKSNDYSGHMEQLEEMLPGLENYICVMLAVEKLSKEAEDQRLYFMERLDILRLPPTIVPPRNTSMVQSYTSDDHTSLSSINMSTSSSSARNSEDFAAIQRELSRTFATHLDQSVIEEEVKVYDDIDLDGSLDESTEIQELDLYEVPVLDMGDDLLNDSTDAYMTSSSGDKSLTDHDTSPGHFVYDLQVLPVPHSAPPPLPHAALPLLPHLVPPPFPHGPPPPLPHSAPPPLPPRRHSDETILSPVTLQNQTRNSTSVLSDNSLKHLQSPDIVQDVASFSATASQVTAPNLYSPTIVTAKIFTPHVTSPRRTYFVPSPTSVMSPDSTTYLISAMGSQPPDLPVRTPRPPLPPRIGINAATEKQKETRVDSICESQNGDDTSTSYESYDEEHPGPHDPDLLHELNIKLPIPFDKRRKKKLNKSVSSLQDVDNNYKTLPDVTISGDLLYHGKISWSRRLSAVSRQRLLCYKPQKLSRPSFVLPLSGYHVTVKNRDTKRGTDLILTHPSREEFEFCVEYREWANFWSDYIQAAASNRPPPGKPIKLFRYSGHSSSSLLDEVDTVTGKPDMYRMMSNRSMGSLELISEQSDKQDRVGRMATLANRASNLFESLGKRRTPRRLPTTPEPPNIKISATSTSSNGTRSPSLPDMTRLMDGVDELELETPEEQSTHKGYMNVFSNYNRKSWGKWLCVVRDNEFACYRNDRSKHADLTVQLRQCEIRHAVEETKSEKSLMLLMGGEEQITVEALTFEELDGWLRVLVRETATSVIPEGLVQYYVEKEYNDIKEETQYSVIKDVESTKYLSIEDIAAEEEFDPSVYTPVAKPGRSLRQKNQIIDRTDEKNTHSVEPEHLRDSCEYPNNARYLLKQRHVGEDKLVMMENDSSEENSLLKPQIVAACGYDESHREQSQRIEVDVVHESQGNGDVGKREDPTQQDIVGNHDSGIFTKTDISMTSNQTVDSNVKSRRRESIFDVDESPYDEVFCEQHGSESSDLGDNGEDVCDIVKEVSIVGETDEVSIVGETDEVSIVGETDEVSIVGETDEVSIVGETDEVSEDRRISYSVDDTSASGQIHFNEILTENDKNSIHDGEMNDALNKGDNEGLLLKSWDIKARITKLESNSGGETESIVTPRIPTLPRAQSKSRSLNMNENSVSNKMTRSPSNIETSSLYSPVSPVIVGSMDDSDTVESNNVNNTPVSYSFPAYSPVSISHIRSSPNEQSIVVTDTTQFIYTVPHMTDPELRTSPQSKSPIDMSPPRPKTLPDIPESNITPNTKVSRPNVLVNTAHLNNIQNSHTPCSISVLNTPQIHASKPSTPNSNTSSSSSRSAKSPSNYSVKSRVFSFERSTKKKDSPTEESPTVKKKLPSSFSLNFLKHFTSEIKKEDSELNNKNTTTMWRRSSSRELRRKRGSGVNESDHSRYYGVGHMEEMSSEELKKTVEQLKNKLIEMQKSRSHMMDKKVSAATEKDRHRFRDDISLVEMDCYQLNRDIGRVEQRLDQLMHAGT